uniref:Tail assembly chaperone n=4 Tax=unclassified bacterial viruses TaxID=12333 RepID=A0AAU6W2K2_9VIRU
MARRFQVVTIEDGNSRDAGKSFLVTEMDAEGAEWWAFRVLQAVLGSDAEVDFQAPLAQLARQGLGALAKLSPTQAKPLLDEMMQCVAVSLPGGKGSRALLPNDIEEVGTRVLLRKAVMELHVGFLENGAE